MVVSVKCAIKISQHIANIVNLTIKTYFLQINVLILFELIYPVYNYPAIKYNMRII